jgi:hypothetical protein
VAGLTIGIGRAPAGRPARIPPARAEPPGERDDWRSEIEAERRCQAGVVADDLGVVGRVELVEAAAVDLDPALAEDDLLVLVDLDDLPALMA